MGHIRLGKYNRLTVLRKVDFGVYLDGEDDGDILLPARYVPADCKTGDVLDVFVYLDNEERLIATTERPYAQVGEFACLEVAWTNRYGAFLNWGLMKDLFVPFSEQKERMEKGRRYVVYIYVDDTSYRIVASAYISRFLSDGVSGYEPNDEVDILVWQRTNLGFKVIIDNRFGGLLYHNEIFQPVEVGMSLKAYVKQVREDGKIDLMLQKQGMGKVKEFSDVLLQYLEDHNGFIPMTDKTDPETIYRIFSVSKKTFKKGVGDLYKKRLIVLEDSGIRLTLE